MPASPPRSQSVIVPMRQPYARTLAIAFKPGSFNRADFSARMQAMHARRHVLSRIAPADRIFVAAAFAPALWDRLHPRRPAGFRPLQPMAGAHRLEVLGADLFVHIASSRADLAFEVSCALMEGWEAADLIDERDCFQFFDGRDLTGFIDGVENPQDPDGRAKAALIGEGEFAGGSFLFAARFIHDMIRWRREPVEAQERVFGRSKLESIEMDDAVKPPTAHSARADIDIDIVRHSMPYGSGSGEKGSNFLAYATSLDTLETMLKRMYGVSGDGLSDALLNFTSTPGGAFYFAPSQDLLDAMLDIEDD